MRLDEADHAALTRQADRLRVSPGTLARMLVHAGLGEWSDLAALDLVLHPFDLARDGSPVAAITRRLRRRHATDSTYVHLAQQLDTAAWTLDGALARSAADVGLPVELIT